MSFNFEAEREKARKQVATLSREDVTVAFADVTTNYIFENDKLFDNDAETMFSFISLTAELVAKLNDRLFGKLEESEDEENEETAQIDGTVC